MQQHAGDREAGGHQRDVHPEQVRLRLEEIEAWQPPGLEHETARALHEVDRLQATVDDLLTLAREGSDGRPVLSVSDEGAGVAPGSERVVFQRGGSTAGGTGVGLHLVRSLVEAENGRLRVAPGRPTRFEIVFPQGVGALEGAN